jgi:hypothetical protein
MIISSVISGLSVTTSWYVHNRRKETNIFAKICAKTRNFGKTKFFALVSKFLMSSICLLKNSSFVSHVTDTFFDFFAIKHRKSRHLFFFAKKVAKMFTKCFVIFCTFSQAVFMKISNWFAQKSFNTAKPHFFRFNLILHTYINPIWNFWLSKGVTNTFNFKNFF